MQRAGKAVAVENANVAMSNIRWYEVSYFSVYYDYFSAQAGIIILSSINLFQILPQFGGNPSGSGGLNTNVYNYFNSTLNATVNYTSYSYYYSIVDDYQFDDIMSITEPITSASNDIFYFKSYLPIQALYWISSTAAFAVSMLILINSVFVSIYGQSLTFRGPVGSMVKSLEGMRRGQLEILLHFSIALVFFSISVIGMNFAVMVSLPNSFSQCNHLIFCYVASHASICLQYNNLSRPTILVQRNDQYYQQVQSH